MPRVTALCYYTFYFYLRLFSATDSIVTDLALKLTDYHITASYCITSDGSPPSAKATKEVNGRWWLLEKDVSAADYNIIYIGGENRTLSNLMLTLNTCQFYAYDPQNEQARLLDRSSSNRCLMKRYYLIEKARDARIVGLLFGTMSVKSCVTMHDRLRQLVLKAG